MRARLQSPVAAFLILMLAGCSNGSHTPSPSGTPLPSKSAPAVASLPNPLPADLLLGTKILFQQSGHGPQVVALPKLGNDKTISVKWACQGSDNLQITDSGKILVGSACADGSPPSVFGGDIPRSDITSTTWRITAGPSTTWRIVIYAEP